MATSGCRPQGRACDNICKDQLKAIVERIERLEEERRPSRTISATSMRRPKATASTSRRCARSFAYASRTPTMRAEQETILDTYMQALGML